MRRANFATTMRARLLRRESPHAERRLWRGLRGRRLADFKFARQEPIGPFFADFVCRAQRLVIEVDGATHANEDEMRYDQMRAAWLRGQGYCVLRLGNMDVYENLEGVVEAIYAALKS
jgi:very-short-patch-repair endonuclease